MPSPLHPPPPTCRALQQNKGRILLAHASSAYRHALKEVLASPAVAAAVADTKAAREAAALGRFFEALASDPSRAFYGPAHVTAAAEVGAVQTLLLSDARFRAADPREVQSPRVAGGGVGRCRGCTPTQPLPTHPPTPATQPNLPSASGGWTWWTQ